MEAQKERLIEYLEKRLGYIFNSKSLLFSAITHKSFLSKAKRREQQRLEFLGDAVLNFCVSNAIYEKFPEWDEGKMSVCRGNVVRNENLGRIARRLGIGECVILGKGEELDGGREKMSILGDTLEAIIGAIFLDGGYKVAEGFIKKHILRYTLRRTKSSPDPKSALQALSLKKYHTLPMYRLVSEKGAPHSKRFRVSVQVAEKRAYGSGRSKKEAEKKAAQNLLKKERKNE